MRKYIIFAGVNGAGKSTLFQTLKKYSGMNRVNSVDIAKKRIRNRVNNGGHGIPDSDVERRFIQSMQNLIKVIPYTDITILYDNTESFRRFAIYRNGKKYLVSSRTPEWYNIIQNT